GLAPVAMTEAVTANPPSGGGRAGHGMFMKVVVPDVGTSEADLVFLIPSIDKTVCDEIHKFLGIRSDLVIPYSAWPNTLYNNSFASADTLNVSLSKIRAGCFTNSSPMNVNSIHFYYVLVAR